MKLWHAGDIMELLKEAETIQKDLRVSNTPSTIVEISKKFAREMRKGNINSAIKLLADNMKNGIHPLNDQTLHRLNKNTDMVKMHIQKYYCQTYREKFILSNSIRLIV